MKKIIASFFLCLLCSLSFAQSNQAKFIGDGMLRSRGEVTPTCLEWQEAQTSDKIIGTAAGTAVGGGLGAAAGKVIGGKTGAAVGGLVGAGLGGAAGAGIASERKCLKRDHVAYEYLVVMSDKTLIKVVQPGLIYQQTRFFDLNSKPTKVKVYQFPDQSYSIVLDE